MTANLKKIFIRCLLPCIAATATFVFITGLSSCRQAKDGQQNTKKKAPAGTSCSIKAEVKKTGIMDTITAIVAGMVYHGGSNKPVPGFTVVLEADGEGAYTTVSNNTGKFRLDHIRAAQYTMRMYYPGARSHYVPLSAGPGSIIEVTAELVCPEAAN